MSDTNLTNQIMNLIAQNYGHDLDDMSPDWDLMEEVGLFNSSLNNADDDVRFIMQLNHQFDIELDVQDISNAVKRGEIVSIDDLIELIEDEALAI